MKKYEIMWSGSLLKSNVKISHEGPLLYPPAEQQYIDEVWSKRQKETISSGQTLYNSNIFGLISIDGSESGSLNTVVNTTNYSSYVASRAPESHISRANAIGTSVVPITSDGFIPLGKRSSNAEVNPGKYFTFGGFFDADTDIVDGNPCIFSCIGREIYEELGVSVDVNSLRMTAIVKDLINIHPEFCFLAKLELNRTQIKQAKWGEELESIEFINVINIDSFVEDNFNNFTPTLLGGIKETISTL